MANKEFNTEADLRNFKSKILLLPKKLQMQINQMIDDGKREWAIENYIKKNYKGTLGAPTPPTIKTYILWYEAKKRIQSEQGIEAQPLTRTEVAIVEKTTALDIVQEHKLILSQDTDVNNKKELLESLLKKCIQRITRIENLQDIEGMTASLEAVLGSYIREIHSITTTQLKLAGELQEETNATINKLVNQNLYQLIVLVFRVINKLDPKIVPVFKQEFFEEIKSHKELGNIDEFSSNAL